MITTLPTNVPGIAGKLKKPKVFTFRELSLGSVPTGDMVSPTDLEVYPPSRYEELSV